MSKIKDLYKIFEKTVSNVKFAVIIISLFALTLVLGTFMESYHGAGYANRMVYKSWWFIFLEVCMFISIFMATVVRLPAKKRLYGFYTIHTGLITLFIGSFFTYINGIDGSLQLLPNTPAHTVLVNEDILKVEMPAKNKMYKLKLPYVYTPTKLNTKIENIEIVEYLPYAENKIQWISESGHNPQQHSTTYMIFNTNVSQEVTLSLSPKSDFKSMTRMGLLNLHYMPSILKDCFAKNSPSGFIIWHLGTGECFTPEEKKLHIGKTKTKTTFVLVKHNNEYLKFFPDVSPVAVNDDLTKRTDVPYRVLSKRIFEKKPNLFMFGKDIAFYKKKKKKWLIKSFTDDNNTIQLPWMGFQLQLLKHSNKSYPAEIPTYIKPVQENGNIIRGNIKAVKIKFYDKYYWVRDDGPLELSSRNSSETIRFQIQPKEINLPYQLTLDRFQMNKNPGTNNPASYESFVQLVDGRTNAPVANHHVYMNNPLKYDDFTFYQSSYFPIGQGQFGSVLSVNYDPGRFFKYMGCFLIVFGCIWHFIINRKKTKVIKNA